jgi:3-hydroxybutyryl-CoA dehydratase
MTNALDGFTRPSNKGIVEYSERVTVTSDKVFAFADVSGDLNPIHLTAINPIAHGALLLGLVSKVVGMEFPGPGTIIVTWESMFNRPVPVGADVWITVKLATKYPPAKEGHRPKADLLFTVKKPGKDGLRYLSGALKVILPEGM